MPNVRDLTGQRYGKLTVIGRAENDKWGRTRWLCKCDCGHEKVVGSQELTRGNTTSCGCNYRTSNKAVDLTGQRFGRLTVLERDKGRTDRVAWICKCDCGNVKSVLSYKLTSGTTRSCGCLQRETAAKNATRHGYYGERLRNVWATMKQRCTNPKCKDYPFYGGRGITVCEEWNDYLSFRKWAYSAGYAEGLTIDRIDVDGPYAPHNCRWISLKQQMLNRRSSLAYREPHSKE